MRLGIRCVVYLFGALVLPTTSGYAPNPPQCATAITGTLSSITEGARRIARASNECISGWLWGFGLDEDLNSVDNGILIGLPATCAMDVAASIKYMLAGGKQIASAAFNCGDVDSACAQQVLSSLVDVLGFSQHLSYTTFQCQFNKWWCAGGIADLSVDVVTLAQDITTGLDVCSGVKFTPPPPPGYVTAPKPSDPSPEPDVAPEPQADQPSSPFGDDLETAFFPELDASSPSAGSERRLGPEQPREGMAEGGIDPGVLRAAERERENLQRAMGNFHLMMGQVLRRIEFVHLLRGKGLPEHLRILKQRLANVTEVAREASAKFHHSSDLGQVLAKLKDVQKSLLPASTGAAPGQSNSSMPMLV